jgi:hypothetical protein
MKIETKKWLDAGYILQSDPSAKVQCPECGVGILIVKDEPIGTSDNRIDRYLMLLLWNFPIITRLINKKW